MIPPAFKLHSPSPKKFYTTPLVKVIPALFPSFPIYFYISISQYIFILWGIFWYFYVPDDPTQLLNIISPSPNKFYTHLWGSSCYSQSSQCIFFYSLVNFLVAFSEMLWWSKSILPSCVVQGTGGVGWKGWKCNNPISCLPWSIPRALRAAESSRIEFPQPLTALPACTAFMEARKGHAILTPQLSQGKWVDILRSDMIQVE